MTHPPYYVKPWSLMRGAGGGAKKGPFTWHPLRRLVEGPKKKAPPLDSLEGVGLSEPTKKKGPKLGALEGDARRVPKKGPLHLVP